MNKINTIFIGTSEFAVPILEACLNHELLEVNAVITQPDRPTGRKQVLEAPPVKQLISEKLKDKSYRLDIVQPENIKKMSVEIVEKYKPELIIVASYGQIIPNSILNYPKYGCLNFHASLLPILRGAVPIQMSILQGLGRTGVTLQKMVYKMDEGPIISQREINLHGDETYESLTKVLSDLSVDILKEDLEDWIKGSVEAIEQDHSLATYCYISDTAKNKAEITSETSIEEAERMVRAFYPWPVAWITIKEGKYKDKRLKIYQSQILNSKLQILSNENLKIKNEEGNLVLNLKDGVLLLQEVQLEGKERRSGEEYLWLVD